MKRLWLVLCVLGLGAAAAQEDGLASLRFVVLRDSNGKPIRNAAVVLHPVKKNGKQERGGLELKCDADGKASFDGVPYGKLRIQVLAQGFQTYGEDFEINEPDKEITVRMKRPTEQYSIYTDKQNTPKEDSGEKKDGSAQKDAKPQ